MFPWQETIPDSPPALNNRVELSTRQVNRIQAILSNLSTSLALMPILVSQHGEVIAFAGESEAVVDQLARIADRTWREGATRLAREYIRFEEEVFERGESRLSLMLYSRHIEGALTLSAGWQLGEVSLTQLRAEINDAREDIVGVI